jgi:hypothetical protein
VLPVVVALGFLAVWLPLEQWKHSFPRLSQSVLAQGIGNESKSWIDAAAGRDAHVAVLWTGGNVLAVWQNEFWNRSVNRVYDLGATLPGDMPATQVSVQRSTGVLRDASGQPIREQYVLATTSVNLVGQPIAHDTAKKLVLYRVTPPARTTTRIVGLHDDPTRPWSGPQVTWERLNCSGGALRVEVSSDARTFAGVRQTLRISGTTSAQTRHLRPTTDHLPLTLPLTPQDGVCRVVFDVSPTRVPRNFPKLNNPDPRELGLHFDSIKYLPPR